MINIPTLQDLYNTIVSDIETELGVTLPTSGKSMLRAFAAVQAAKLRLFYLQLGNLQRQISPDTADREAQGGSKEVWGRLKLNRDPDPATQGQYEVEVTGTVGAVIPAQTTFKSDDDSRNPGMLFILDAAFTLTSSPDTITIRALEAGTDSQMDVGDTLTSTAPILNVSSSVEVTAETTTPQDEEDIDDYTDEILQSFLLEPQGGAASDYRLWSLDATGVAQAYAYNVAGSDCEVDVFVEATIAASSDGKGSAGAGILSDVEDCIELDPDTSLDLSERGRRPLGILNVNVQSITPLDVDITIASFQDLTAAKQTLIEDALAELCAGIRPFVAGADDVTTRNDVLSHNNIIAAILNVVPGAVFGAITLVVNSVTLTTKTFSDGDIPYLNSVTV